VEVALYRIAQECVQNVLKHAGATRVRLAFSVRGGRARLEVGDDGVGFDGGTARARDAVEVADAVTDPGEGGYGYWSMRERAELVGGVLRVASRPGAGTTVTVTVPVASTNSEESTLKT
jgi:two-component system NarL family sensor kinase